MMALWSLPLRVRARLRALRYRAADPGSEAARREILALLASGGLRTVDVPACPSCGACGADEPVTDHDRVGLPHPTALCARCGLAYARQRLDDRSLARLYDGLYWRLIQRPAPTDPAIFSRGEDALAALRPHLRDVASWRPRVLEVGAGAGWNLVAFARAGCAATGFDVDDAALRQGREEFGLDMRPGDMERAVASDARADVLLLCHVVEHVPDARAFLRCARELLADGGLVYIEVPGLLAIDEHPYLGDAVAYFQLPHLHNFTRDTLAALVEEAGFEVVQADERVRLVARRREEPAPPRRDLSREPERIRAALRRSEARFLARRIASKGPRALLRPAFALGRGLLAAAGVPREPIDALAFEVRMALGRRRQRRLEVDPAAPPLLNLGSGPTPLPGFVNADCFGERCDLELDLRHPLPIEDGVIAGIFSEHALEHLTSSEVERLLAECRRVLVPGGWMRLVVPSAGLIARRLAAGDADYFREWERLMFIESADPQRRKRRLRAPIEALSFVTQEYGHRSAWDAELARALFARAGFVEVTERRAGEGSDPRLIQDTKDPERRLVSLYMEARAPGKAS